MSAIGWVRNGLIFAGIGIGGALAIRAATAPAPTPENQGPQAGAPVVLNTARPADAPVARLGKPVSLESPFGRTEITGIPTFRLSPDPLNDLGVNREYDGSIDLSPVKMETDLPPAKAPDEVQPREDVEPAPVAPSRSVSLDDLPKDARQHADAGKADLDQGNQLLIDGLSMVRGGGDARQRQEGNLKLADAARFFESARDHFREALLRAPNHPGVLELVQEAKANLFTARKHGTVR